MKRPKSFKPRVRRSKLAAAYHDNWQGRVGAKWEVWVNEKRVGVFQEGDFTPTVSFNEYPEFAQRAFIDWRACRAYLEQHYGARAEAKWKAEHGSPAP